MEMLTHTKSCRTLFWAPKISGHYALHCNDLNFSKHEKIVIEELLYIKYIIIYNRYKYLFNY